MKKKRETAIRDILFVCIQCLFLNVNLSLFGLNINVQNWKIKPVFKNAGTSAKHDMQICCVYRYFFIDFFIVAEGF